MSFGVLKNRNTNLIYIVKKLNTKFNSVGYGKQLNYLKCTNVNWNSHTWKYSIFGRIRLNKIHQILSKCWEQWHAWWMCQNDACVILTKDNDGIDQCGEEIIGDMFRTSWEHRNSCTAKAENMTSMLQRKTNDGR